MITREAVFLLESASPYTSNYDVNRKQRFLGNQFRKSLQYEKLCELGFEDNPYVKHWCLWDT